jgi:hypothetical protein
VAFAKDKLRLRIERFIAYVNDLQGFTCHQVDSSDRGKNYYIVCSGDELAMVVFAYTGGVQLTALAGRLKELMLVWVRQEVCPYYDNSSPGEIAKLDPYRYLLQQTDVAHDPRIFPTPGALQLTPRDNPLVELAELLGYMVYLLPTAESTASRYGIANQQEMVAQGDHLPAMLAQLLTGLPVEDQTGSPPSLIARKIYLPKNVQHPLAYWRKQTKMPDGSWITQRMLAAWAGLNVHTVQRIEQERREHDHAHVYLSTAKSVIAALNEVREQQEMPLIQLWNIDWASEEQDEEYTTHAP